MAAFNGTEDNDSLFGGAAADELNGFGGNDFMQGGDGADTVLGGSGNDTISGNAGNDWVRGGTGNDQVTGGGGQDSFAFADFGATNADVLTDFASNWDNIQLDVSAFTALGSTGRFGSNDGRFWLGTAAHDADDRIIYNQATGQLWYDADGNGAGAAQLIATISNRGAVGASDIFIFQSSTTPPPPPPGSTTPTEGNDSLVGTAGNDTIDGLGGSDTIRGLGGEDLLIGGGGTDSLFGGDGNDTLIGDERARERDGPTADTLDGGMGNDVYHVNFDDIILPDPGGIDHVLADTTWTLADGLENLTIGGVEADGASAFGNELDNVISQRGNEHYHTIEGRGGNDVLYAGQRAMSGGGVFGGDGNDTLVGWTGADLLVGGDGNDLIMGSDVFGGGSDFNTVDGGAGNDTLSGSAGSEFNDVFRFSVAPGAANADTITAFESGIDTIELDGRAHLSSGPSGAFVAADARFHTGTAAHDADDRVIFNSATRQLWYDADGNGAGAAQLIATIQSGSVAATDIRIVNGSSTPPPPPPPADGTNGTEGNDTMFGTAGSDTINGLGGNDYIQGNAGMDTVRGGAGNDTIGGNADNDWLEGGAGNDQIAGGGGQDAFVFREFGAANADTLTDFASGWDNIQLDLSAFTALGSTGRLGSNDGRFWLGTAAHDADDRIIYNQATGQLWYDADGAGAGAAQLIATLSNRGPMSASDIYVYQSSSPPPPPPPGAINGTNGNDSLAGGSGNDTIFGFGGNDTIDGGAGADSMVGGTGDDLYFVDNPLDVVVDQQNEGTDEVRSTVNYTLADWVNNLTLIGNATDGIGNAIDNVIVGNALDNFLRGGDGNDSLSGGDGNDTLMGGAGDDTLIGGNGNDSIFITTTAAGAPGRDVVDGGAGENWLAYDGHAQSAVIVDMTAGTASGGGAGGSGSVAFSNIQNVVGTPFGDVIKGHGGDNQLSGGGGNDTISGGVDGVDQMWGGAGADSFVLDRTSAIATYNIWIRDFAPGEDKLHLDARVMPAVGADGNFVANDPRFYAASGATSGHDADDRVIYDTTNAALYYDPDGSGPAAAQRIAVFSSLTSAPPPSIQATDIVVDNGTTGSGGTPPPGNINGTEGNDTLIGTSGSDTINGLGGNDYIQGNAGMDTIRGGAGNDTIGGNGDNDWLEGGAGNDQMAGGSGQDAFVFRDFGAANADTLTDFASNWDNLRFDGTALTALGSTGRFGSSDGRFWAGTAAHDADDRIIFNSATGQVWYDTDGSGAGAAQLVATLQTGATLVASDIWVI